MQTVFLDHGFRDGYGGKVGDYIGTVRIAADHHGRTQLSGKRPEFLLRIEPVVADAQTIDLQRHTLLHGAADQPAVFRAVDLIRPGKRHQIRMREIGELPRPHPLAYLIHVLPQMRRIGRAVPG